MHVLWNFKNNNRKLHLLFLQTFSVPNAPTCFRLLKVETLDTQYLLLNPFRWPSRHVRNYWPLDSERKEWWLLLDKWPSRKLLSFMYSRSSDCDVIALLKATKYSKLLLVARARLETHHVILFTYGTCGYNARVRCGINSSFVIAKKRYKSYNSHTCEDVRLVTGSLLFNLIVRLLTVSG